MKELLTEKANASTELKYALEALRIACDAIGAFLYSDAQYDLMWADEEEEGDPQQLLDNLTVRLAAIKQSLPLIEPAVNTIERVMNSVLENPEGSMEESEMM